MLFDSFFSKDIVRAAHGIIEDSIFLGFDSPSNENTDGWENFYTVTELVLDNFDYDREEGHKILWAFYKWYYPRYFQSTNSKGIPL
jgi:hypothetical protein